MSGEGFKDNRGVLPVGEEHDEDGEEDDKGRKDRAIVTIDLVAPSERCMGCHGDAQANSLYMDCKTACDCPRV